ncbi:putative glycine-rich cell wall structural protein 1 [Vicia villosa]|uniref:putative glycine-rich cell wall structural protein 1 n=1 Tax=Vicia villosa TaxID=3911 RepID=UPI00273AF18C|nr:putative glycine-rich cell wall structural protein 1 [Vicia villosa]XP_058784909.1 putative glycine-rich cell wall structural protein 1 [Vicia villosa]
MDFKSFIFLILLSGVVLISVVVADEPDPDPPSPKKNVNEDLKGCLNREKGGRKMILVPLHDENCKENIGAEYGDNIFGEIGDGGVQGRDNIDGIGKGGRVNDGIDHGGGKSGSGGDYGDGTGVGDGESVGSRDYSNGRSGENVNTSGGGGGSEGGGGGY